MIIIGKNPKVRTNLRTEPNWNWDISIQTEVGHDTERDFMTHLVDQLEIKSGRSFRCLGVEWEDAIYFTEWPSNLAVLSPIAIDHSSLEIQQPSFGGLNNLANFQSPKIFTPKWTPALVLPDNGKLLKNRDETNEGLARVSYFVSTFEYGKMNLPAYVKPTHLSLSFHSTWPQANSKLVN